MSCSRWTDFTCDQRIFSSHHPLPYPSLLSFSSYAGIATHYVPSSRLQALEDRLSELETSDHEVINAAIEDFVGEISSNNSSLQGDTRRAIDRCFRFNSVDEIIQALGKEETDWAKTTTDTLLRMSPTSLKVTLQQLRKGKQLGIADCFKMEFNLVQKFLVGNWAG